MAAKVKKPCMGNSYEMREKPYEAVEEQRRQVLQQLACEKLHEEAQRQQYDYSVLSR